MKSTLLPFLLLLLTSLSVAAQTVPEPPDTIKLIKKPEKVTVSRSGETTVILVESTADNGSDTFIYEVTVGEPSGADSDPMIDFEMPFGIGRRKGQGSGGRKLQTSVFALGNIYYGQRFNYSDKGAVKNSTEVGIRNAIGMRWSHGPCTPAFSIGLGLGVNRFSAQTGFMYCKDGSDLILVPVDEGVRIRSTEFNVYNFQIPLLFTIPIGKVVEFEVGAIGCFNTYAKASTELDFGDYKTTAVYKGLQQRLFTAELTAAIGVCDILGLYASWSPVTLFQSPYGPQLKSWSLGAMINF